MGTLPVAAEDLITSYPRRDKKDSSWPDVVAVMTGLPGTPCCVQISRALCGGGLPVPARSWRRGTVPFPNGSWRALLATDEVEEFLSVSWGEGENLQGSTPDAAKVKGAIGGVPGVLIFRHGLRRGFPPHGKFEHTEIWDGTRILQRDMNEGYLFSCPRVLFWPTNESAPTDFEV